VRTTVTLDPDTEALVRRRMRERGVSFKQALNDAIREGALARGVTRTFSTATADLGMPSVNLDHALRVAADVEDEELLRKMRIGT
jgi:hypothetical protein